MEDKIREREFFRRNLMYCTNNKKHICETLRFIYDEVHTLEEGERKSKMTELLIDAMTMAKKMQDRLSYYQRTYKDNTGNKAINIIGLTGVNARSRMRRARAV